MTDRGVHAIGARAGAPVVVISAREVPSTLRLSAGFNPGRQAL
eukprot:CAMPEP_0167784064 /NCGR_PEP_ID=MMETSP0111_2-20121227/7424_1 /TAXON_ID=91324 /ORGANISM="Lotharella globosa, Strain CCCM811" /LENGTH=42 /DNA_ID= /DNA_START= /DNA_END= /DNA_ORIENTATION=